jgi:uncharacterized pyridoxamine 5'-phosphate oxidase family protein
MYMNKKSVIYNFLKQNKYMALATSSKQGKPEVATVEYVIDGDDLLINTYVYYRKYKNISNNPNVACVVTTNHDMTLQFDGNIKQLEGEEATYAKQKMLEVEPDFADYFSDEDTRFFRITLTWMRLRDYTKESMEETEYIP